jgi:hypothetical protein
MARQWTYTGQRKYTVEQTRLCIDASSVVRTHNPSVPFLHRTDTDRQFSVYWVVAVIWMRNLNRREIMFKLWVYRRCEYCDMSTHCWVAQQSVARQPTGKQDSSQARWRHTSGVRECHVCLRGCQETSLHPVRLQREWGTWRDSAVERPARPLLGYR